MEVTEGQRVYWFNWREADRKLRETLGRTRLNYPKRDGRPCLQTDQVVYGSFWDSQGRRSEGTSKGFQGYEDRRKGLVVSGC